MNEIIQAIATNGVAIVGLVVVYWDMREERKKEREENAKREEKLYQQITSGYEREVEYQKIIQDYQKTIQEYTYEIIPTLGEIKGILKEGK